MFAPPPPTTTRIDIAQAVGNLIWTTALVVASPLLLAHFFGYPLPQQMPDWADVLDTPLQLVEPSVFINAIVCVGWIGWSVVIFYVAIDLVDLARGIGHRVRRLGPASIVAGKLIASIALLLSLFRPQPATGSLYRPEPTVQVLEAPTSAPFNAVLIRSDAPVPAATADTETPSLVDAPIYVVQRGDSLWRIAEQELGDGFRWKEIHQLNRAIIANPDLICVGWTLTLPDDAAPAQTARVPPTTQAASAPTDIPLASTTTATPPVAPEVVAPAATTTEAHGSSGTTLEPSTTAPTSTQAAPTTGVTTVEPAVTPPDSQPSTSPSAVATNDPSTTLPLSLRAQGPESQAKHDDWARQQADRPQTGDADRSGLSQLATTGIPLLVAATVIATVDRRRRRVLQRRPLHGPIPHRNPLLHPAEGKLRARPLADPVEQIAWIDAVLRLLTTVFQESPLDAQLLLVRAGTLGVELLWDRRPAVACPGLFRALDDRAWEYPCGDELALHDLQSAMVGVAHHTHALVSLGDTREGPVLVNLQAVDQIDITGDHTVAGRWLAGTILELEAHPWAEVVDVAVTPAATLPARVNTSIHLEDDGTARPLVWRTDRTETPGRWALHFSEHEALLRCDELGLDIQLSPVGVDADVFASAAALLDEAARDPYVEEGVSGGAGDPPGPTPWHPEAAPTEVGDDLHRVGTTGGPQKNADYAEEPDVSSGAVRTGTLVADRPSAATAADLDRDALLVVRVLGPVRTEGWHKQPKSPRTEDIVVYLAMARPDRVSRERLIDALWNGKDVSTKLLFNYIGTLRKELGEPAAVSSADGTYVLGEGVRSDWEHFNEITKSAEGCAWPERRAALSEGLSLVYGRPFDMTDRHPWAATEGTISRIEVAITDVAADLATESLAHGDHAMAIWAARRGLSACPWHVRLYGYIIEAHTSAGDAASVEHTWRELNRAAGSDGVPDELRVAYQAALAK